jgi:hypothetical protein
MLLAFRPWLHQLLPGDEQFNIPRTRLRPAFRHVRSRRDLEQDGEGLGKVWRSLCT